MGDWCCNPYKWSYGPACKSVVWFFPPTWGGNDRLWLHWAVTLWDPGEICCIYGMKYCPVKYMKHRDLISHEIKILMKQMKQSVCHVRVLLLLTTINLVFSLLATCFLKGKALSLCCWNGIENDIGAEFHVGILAEKKYGGCRWPLT